MRLLLNGVTQPGVEPIPEPVADEVQRHYQEEDHHPREERNPPGGSQVITAFSNHCTPCRGRRWNSRSKEAKDSFSQDQLTDTKRSNHDNRVDYVWHNVLPHNPYV